MNLVTEVRQLVPHRQWWMAIGIALLGVIIVLGSQPLWPAPTIHLDNMQSGFFIVLGIIEALICGIGLAFAYLAPTLFRTAKQLHPRLFWATYFALIYGAVTWVIHDKLHSTLPLHDIWGLVWIEYIFHLPLALAAVLLMVSFYVFAGDRQHQDA